MAAWLALLILLLSGVVLVGRHDAFVIGGMDAAQLAMTASGLLLAVWLSGALLPRMRETHPRAYRLVLRVGGTITVGALAIWLHGPLTALTGAAWSAWGRELPLPEAVTETLSRWRGSIPAAALVRSGEQAVRIRKRADGQFHATAALNGAPATLVVDSGAATVVLKAADARHAGIDMSQLSYTVPLDTANGSTFAARVRLRSVRIGIIAVEDVEALVAEPGRLESSLLGSSFLSRLRSYEFSGPFLTFRG